MHEEVQPQIKEVKSKSKEQVRNKSKWKKIEAVKLKANFTETLKIGAMLN